MTHIQKYFLLILLLFSQTQLINAQPEDEAPLSLHRVSLELGMQFGNFELLGNEADPRIVRSGRKQNTTFGKSFGFGFTLNYTTIKGLDIFYNSHYEYVNEKLVEVYSLSMRDIGLRYQVAELGPLLPFVKLSQTSYTLGGLRVFDPTIQTGSTTREYDWKGRGFTLGGGVDFKCSERALLSLYANKLLPTGELEKLEGGVDFENLPTFGNWGWSFRFYL